MVCIHSVATASVLALRVNQEVMTRYCVRTRTRNDPASRGWSTRDDIWYGCGGGRENIMNSVFHMDIVHTRLLILCTKFRVWQLFKRTP